MNTQKKTTRTVTKVVAAKVDPLQRSKLDLLGGAAAKFEPMVLSFTATGFGEQLVLHRPVRPSHLSETDDWVVSTSESLRQQIQNGKVLQSPALVRERAEAFDSFFIALPDSVAKMYDLDQGDGMTIGGQPVVILRNDLYETYQDVVPDKKALSLLSKSDRKDVASGKKAAPTKVVEKQRIDPKLVDTEDYRTYMEYIEDRKKAYEAFKKSHRSARFWVKDGPAGTGNLPTASSNLKGLAAEGARSKLLAKILAL